MRVKITAEVHNGAIRGNTYSKVIEIDDEDLEGLEPDHRDRVIDAEVKEAVLNGMVGWDWEIAE